MSVTWPSAYLALPSHLASRRCRYKRLCSAQIINAAQIKRETDKSCDVSVPGHTLPTHSLLHAHHTDNKKTNSAVLSPHCQQWYILICSSSGSPPDEAWAMLISMLSVFVLSQRRNNVCVNAFVMQHRGDK